MKFEPTKKFYEANQGKKVQVRHTKQALVTSNTTRSQSGSWERGFKFHATKWAMLKRTRIAGRRKWLEYSFDHGKTWFLDVETARKSVKKGKIKLDTKTNKEFAFDSIQRINRDYDPNYKWRP